MENDSSQLVAIACLVKRHTYKENRWKAFALSGVASPWFEKITEISLGDNTTQKISVKIEVPLSHSAEFFVSFAEEYTPAEKSELRVARELFPKLDGNEFYLCDILGKEVKSSLGNFRVVSYFENGHPSSQLSTLSVQLEKLQSGAEGDNNVVEVPLAILKKQSDGWHAEDLDLWMNKSGWIEDPDSEEEVGE